jgi:hypothetical protein
MATTEIDARAALAKMEAEEKTASETLVAIQKKNAEQRDALKKELRVVDLKDIREKCLYHEITATELRGVLKVKGAAKKATPAKSPRKPAAKKRATKAA